jgi:hypothetical protein
MKIKTSTTKTWLLYILLALVGCYHGGCIQIKTYKYEPTEAEKKQIIEKAAEKMAEKQKNKQVQDANTEK